MSDLQGPFLMQPEGHLMRDLYLDRVTKKEFAITYSLAMASPEDVDFSRVNQHIMDRWGENGLKLVKKRAWERINGAANATTASQP